MTAPFVKFTRLATFGVMTPEGLRPTRGGHPRSGLLLASDGRLYGQAWQNGPNDGGRVVDDDEDPLTPELFKSASSNYFWIAADIQKKIDAENANLQYAQAQLEMALADPNNLPAPEVIAAMKAEIAEIEARVAQLVADKDVRQAVQLRECPGTVYSIKQDGTDFRVEHAFSKLSAVTHPTTGRAFLRNADGYQPLSSLVERDGWIYGTAAEGGLSGSDTAFLNGVGTLWKFQISNAESTFEVVHHFGRLSRFNDGAGPSGTPIPDGDNDWIVVCSKGSDGGVGVIARIDGDTGEATQLHAFPRPSITPGQPVIPLGAPVRIGDVLYGWTLYGGVNPAQIGSQTNQTAGTIWAFDLTTNQLEVLYSFPAYIWPGNSDNSPLQSLMLHSDGNLYGVHEYGGVNGSGLLFRVKLPDRTVTILREFDPRNVEAIPPPRFSGPHGSLPMSTLCEDRYGFLVGTCHSGGAYGAGCVWQASTNGQQYVRWHDFAIDENGYHPHCGVIRIGTGHTYYGTTFAGSADGGYGVIYKVEPIGFTHVTGVDLGAIVESNVIRLGCLKTDKARVQGGEMRINGGLWTTHESTVHAGDEIQLRGVASSTVKTRVLVTIALVSLANSSFGITTRA